MSSPDLLSAEKSPTLFSNRLPRQNQVDVFNMIAWQHEAFCVHILLRAVEVCQFRSSVRTGVDFLALVKLALRMIWSCTKSRGRTGWLRIITWGMHGNAYSKIKLLMELIVITAACEVGR